jgi:hypothetical protein
MHRTVLATIAIACVAGASACTAPGGGNIPPESQPAVHGDDTLTVGIGQRVSPPGGAYAVRFVRLVADSRCAANVVCVWQGDAAVRVELAPAGRGAVEGTVHTALEPKTLSADAYTLSVVDVVPHPGASDSAATPQVRVRVVRSELAK